MNVVTQKPVKDDFVHYWKMNGLGNDFVIVDLRGHPFGFSVEQIRALSSRKTGLGANLHDMPAGGRVGCDQFITLSATRDDPRTPVMNIWNANGRRAEACGNASRCVADLIMRERKSDHVRLRVGKDTLIARQDPKQPGMISVDMGVPKLEWDQIPLKAPMNTLQLPIEEGPVANPVAVSMGNPHMVFFVDDVDSLNVVELGMELENHDLYPNSANVGFAQVLAPDRIRLRVFERGAGLTPACGTGACAALVAAVRRKLTRRAATMVLDGGELRVAWLESSSHVIMTGPVTREFEGALDLSRLPK